MGRHKCRVPTDAVLVSRLQSPHPTLHTGAAPTNLHCLMHIPCVPLLLQHVLSSSTYAHMLWPRAAIPMVHKIILVSRPWIVFERRATRCVYRIRALVALRNSCAPVCSSPGADQSWKGPRPCGLRGLPALTPNDSCQRPHLCHCICSRVCPHSAHQCNNSAFPVCRCARAIAVHGQTRGDTNGPPGYAC